jgi:N-acetylglucosaminyl-diphospho-decaprenol L-rhamnosyltransferase
MRLAIVIVSYNAREDLARCLESLQAAPPAIPHDVTIVDNASTEGGLDAIRARWPTAQVIALERNLGFAAGNNVGIRATRSDLVLLLNSDTIVPPGAIDRLVERLTATPAAAAAGPRLIDGAGQTEVSFGPMISPAGEFRQKVTLALYHAGIPPVAQRLERDLRREHFVDWVSGACLLVWRGDADAVGLLDERYFLYTEDVDFCAALRARGRRILFTPSAEITHLRGRSRASAPAAMNAAYRRSHIAFYDKHHPRWAWLLRLYLRAKGALPD